MPKIFLGIPLSGEYHYKTNKFKFLLASKYRVLGHEMVHNRLVFTIKKKIATYIEKIIYKLYFN